MVWYGMVWYDTRYNDNNNNNNDDDNNNNDDDDDNNNNNDDNVELITFIVGYTNKKTSCWILLLHYSILRSPFPIINQQLYYDKIIRL